VIVICRHCLGSEAERGVKPSRSAADINDENASGADDGVVHGSSLSSTYNLPFVMPVIRRHTCNQFLPFCPTFAGCLWVQQRLCGSQDEPSPDSNVADAGDNDKADVEEPIELH